MNREKLIVLDTSILLHCQEYKVDVLHQIDGIVVRPYRFVLASPVLKEIEKLCQNKGKLGIKARTARMILSRIQNELVVFLSNSLPDDSALEAAISLKAMLATGDKGLKNRALRKGLKVIIASGKRVELI